MIHVEVVNSRAGTREALKDFLLRAEDVAAVDFLQVDPACPAFGPSTCRSTDDHSVIRLVEINVAAGDDRIAEMVGALARTGGAPGGLIVCAKQATGKDVGNLFSAGARGFLFSDSPGEEVITAVRAVAEGYLFLPSQLVAELIGLPAERSPGRRSGARATLTGREMEVLTMIASGHSNEGIAENLFIAQATVRSHVLSILRKLSARNRTEAVVTAYRQGLLSIGSEEEAPLLANRSR
ncbi:LuxR C-terminal-related transcriptional regulator [Streptomyces sp. NPDC088864]|uniref:LuxR C-terminal-related transcriptional regulator n=1 Tax=Streptomyces sp. NPDC088864 TaxID=3365910 RepID=UPI003808C8A9